MNDTRLLDGVDAPSSLKLVLSAPGCLRQRRPQLRIDLPASRMLDYRQIMKGTGAKPMVLISKNDVLIHKSAGTPKFALSDCACWPG